MSTIHTLEAIGPVDGRYRGKTEQLKIFSEAGLINCRTIVELRYLRAICKVSNRPLSQEEITLLTRLEEYSLEFAKGVKQAEATINHDVKAVELHLGDQLAGTTLEDVVPWVHNALTSEDTNNLAYGLQLREGVRVLLSLLETVHEQMRTFARSYAALPMLARTHGQPASPTTLGKEFANFEVRILRYIMQLKNLELQVKLNGASGNWSAHEFIAEINWMEFSEEFITEQFPSSVLPFVHNPVTTQVEPHDTYADLGGIIHHTSTMLIGFCQDMWHYISNNWLKLKVLDGEVGSSTMPHKVNPIDFENAEGNLYVARALFDMFEDVLPIMRWQRHLSDCTIIRNFGVGFAHVAIALQSIQRGMGKITPNKDAITAALENEWELLAEPVQVAMRRYRCGEDAYTQLKDLTRGTSVTKSQIQDFIRKTTLPDKVKDQLLTLTPLTYTGYAQLIAKDLRI